MIKPLKSGRQADDDLLTNRHTGRVVRIVLGAALMLVAAFAIKLAMLAFVWQHPPPPDTAPLEGWMTPRFIAHSRHVPPALVARALGLEPGSDGRINTLDEIAAARGEELGALTARLDAAIAAQRGAAHD